MGDRAALAAPSQSPWAATTCEVAPGLERDPVYRGVGMRLVAFAEGLSAGLDRALLFYRWRDDGLLAEINRHLVAAARLSAGRDVQPTAGVIDSQSVKTSENTSLSGYDAGKRIKGRKRHIITDTCGNLITCEVHTANIQDRDGAPGVFARLRREAPMLRHIFADGGYAGPKLRGALVDLGRWTLQIVKRSDTAKGFEVLPRRWVVERTFAWLGRCRRLARDWEKSIESAEAWVMIAHIRRMTRFLARG